MKKVVVDILSLAGNASWIDPTGKEIPLKEGEIHNDQQSLKKFLLKGWIRRRGNFFELGFVRRSSIINVWNIIQNELPNLKDEFLFDVGFNYSVSLTYEEILDYGSLWNIFIENVMNIRN